MQIVVHNDLDVLAEKAGDRIEEIVRCTENPVLGLATGSSPLPIYRDLIRRYGEHNLSFAHCTAFTLDEYIGLPTSHPQRYAAVIRNEFTSHIDIDDARVFTPNGSLDTTDAGQQYEAAIEAAGGIDVQILGVGANGHIAFNEPGADFDSLTHVARLAERTRQDNARFFDSLDEVPTHAVTQGLGTIRRARNLIMIATGEAKAQAIAALVQGPDGTDWPVTSIRHHENLLVLLDEAAASGIASRSLPAS